MDILATTSLEKRLRAIEKTINSMPGNYHYQRVSQNCDVAVVVQQHHTLHNVDDDEDEDDEELDEEEDVDDEDQTNLVHHHHVVMENEDDLTHEGVVDSDNVAQHVAHEQQHSAHTPLEQQQQMHQQQCENVETVDECCQRTTTNQMEVADERMEVLENEHHLQQHHHRHHHHRHHHRTGHNHSLLL